MPRCEIHTANPRHALVGTGKRASSDRWIAGEKPTSPYQSGQLPRTPFEPSRPAADATREVNGSIVA
jgi:hypothetical protein